jgi:hypothetical protein
VREIIDPAAATLNLEVFMSDSFEKLVSQQKNQELRFF